ncbi:MAG: hypothetical protein JNG90_20240 [Planctomycetaceae bacterium]|nr:hypothetical protein [Planctomycetaceae bacterium]
MLRFLGGLALLVAANLVNASRAQAALATFAFSGQITSGPVNGLPGINVGEQSKVVPPSGMQLVVDGQDFSTPATQAWTIGVSNDDPGGFDGIAFSHKFPIAPIPTLPGTTELQLIVQLADSSQTVFSDESLPTLLSPENFDQKTLRIVTSYLTVGAGYVGTIESFTLVPEPATAGLAAAAAIRGAGYFRLSRRSRFSRARR